MSEEEEQFHSSNARWICGKLIDDDDEKGRDHCHIGGEFRGAVSWSFKENICFHLQYAVYEF